MTKLLLRVEEAAEAIACSRSKTYQLLADGSLPSVRVGRSIRVPVAALESWINERAAVAANDNGSKEAGDGRRPRSAPS